VLTLDEARKKARKMLVGIDDGNDPATIKAEFTRASELGRKRCKSLSKWCS